MRKYHVSWISFDIQTPKMKSSELAIYPALLRMRVQQRNCAGVGYRGKKAKYRGWCEGELGGCAEGRWPALSPMWRMVSVSTHDVQAASHWSIAPDTDLWLVTLAGGGGDTGGDKKESLMWPEMGGLTRGQVSTQLQLQRRKRETWTPALVTRGRVEKWEERTQLPSAISILIPCFNVLCCQELIYILCDREEECTWWRRSSLFPVVSWSPPSVFPQFS